MARLVVVTGAESGIGAACAEAFGAEGATVVVCYFADRASADAVVAKVGEAGGAGHAIQMDVSQESSVEAGFDAIGKFGTAQVLVNSAGLNMSGVRVADMTLGQWMRLQNTDLTGSFLTCRRFVQDRKGKDGPGRIINISSIHAEVVRVGGADYCSAKAGLVKLTQTLAVEVADQDITVNTIAPGMILTPMNKKAMTDETYRKSLTDAIPAKRAGTPEEVAALACYLASDSAGYITGANIIIDGGLSLEAGLGA